MTDKKGENNANYTISKSDNNQAIKKKKSCPTGN